MVPGSDEVSKEHSFVSTVHGQESRDSQILTGCGECKSFSRFAAHLICSVSPHHVCSGRVQAIG
jgi:hypothetical protein